jgi:hypothetical protein
MTKLLFKHDKDRDLRNIWETANNSHPWEGSIPPSSGLQRWDGRPYEECSSEIAEAVNGFYESGVLPLFLKCLDDSWQLMNDTYFEKLAKITGSDIYTDSFTAYLTVAGRCPYFSEDDSFMVSSRRPIFQNLRTCGHELLHLQMERTHLPYIRDQLTYREAEFVNESLTAILNVECRNLWLVNDSGYEEHGELREIVMERWIQKPEISSLIDVCIDYVFRKREQLPFLDV